MTTKTCTKCKETKATTEFYKHKRMKDGLFASCKACHCAHCKTWADANKDKRAASVSAWNVANRAQKRATNKAWEKANPDRRAALEGKSNAKGRYPACIPHNFDLVATLPVYAEARKLSADTGVPHQVDHIKPLLYGGLHEASNLQVLTAKDNTNKKTTDKEIYG